MRFHTDYCYIDRQTKSHYVYLKYQSILRGKILDVGADECYLRQYLDEDAQYWGIGWGGNTNQQVDLEKEKIPFGDKHFDCVLCLDVLEHLENIHEVFDELCRVSKRYVIISLPNPYADFWNMLRFGNYRVKRPMKFYNLPLEKSEDRHRWFFCPEEAERFIEYRSKKNNMKIVQLDYFGYGGEVSKIKKLAVRCLLRKDFNLKNLYAGTLWVVLEKLQINK